MHLSSPVPLFECRYRNINCLSFYVPVENITFSSLFGSLEKNRRRLKIEEYTIGQGSLMKALDNILFTRTLRAPYNRTVHFGKRRSHYRANYLNRYEEEDKLNRHTVYWWLSQMCFHFLHSNDSSFFLSYDGLNKHPSSYCSEWWWVFNSLKQ